MQTQNTKLQELKKIENNQKRWDKFDNEVVYTFNEEKQEIKGQKLGNGMEITGIGKKCIKIENNFYSWEDIETAATQGTDDGIMKEIVNFIFPCAYTEEETYTPKKWKRGEVIENFDIIKEEIIAHKEYYKTGAITGIGEKAICITGYGGEKEYISWEEIQKNLKESTISDYKVENNWSSLAHPDVFAIIVDELFVDDEEETIVEKNIKEKDVEYAEEKAYIYRHILKEDLTVEQIRRIVRINHGTEDIEKIVNDCLQFAFKYVKEVKFTDNDYDEEDYNKYAVRDKKSYFYVIKNKEIEKIDENTYSFKDYKKATFKANGIKIDVIRNDEVVYSREGGLKSFYISISNKKIPIAYELTPCQQITILAQEGNIRKVTEEEIKEYFIENIDKDNGIFTELRETISEAYLDKDIIALYDKSEAIQEVTKELYEHGRIHTSIFYKWLNAITGEAHIDKNKIIDIVVWDDSSTSQSVLYDDKYGFDDSYDSQNITLEAGFNSKTYTYTQNMKYTKIEHSSSYIDSFSVETVYLKGTDISEKEIPYYLEYAYGMWTMRNTFQYGYLYKEQVGEEPYATYIRFKL